MAFNCAKYYSPDTGRFLSEDPIGFGSEDFNLYRYVENNPVFRNDPSGLDFEICNRALDIPLGEELMSADPSISHTYLKFDDGEMVSYGPEGRINSESKCSSSTKVNSNKSQDERIKQWAKENYKKTYSLTNYNCKDFVTEAILNGSSNSSSGGGGGGSGGGGAMCPNCD